LKPLLTGGGLGGGTGGGDGDTLPPVLLYTVMVVLSLNLETLTMSIVLYFPSVAFPMALSIAFSAFLSALDLAKVA
jgi:hypothetical protein